MKLPNWQQAVIDVRKLRDYALSPHHPVGGPKAKFFAQIGFDRSNWREFEAAIRAQILPCDAEYGQPSSFGRKYEIRAPLTGLAGHTVNTLSVWIIRPDEEVPRLVTIQLGGRQ